MNVLVVGGAGYVGTVLVPLLIDRGHSADVVDLLWFGNHLPPSVRVMSKDAMHLTEEDLRGYEQVIFLAGLSNDPMAEYAPAKNFVSNAAAPAYLAYLSKRAGVRRYIYASSCSVYGFTADEIFDEESIPHATYPYGISKLQGEFAALSLADPDFSVVVLRKGTVCGFSPRMRLDLVINAMFKSAIADGVITVNNPVIWRPILAIEDAATAYVCAVECSPDVSGVFNVAGGNYQLLQLGETVREGVRDLMGIDAELRILDVSDVRNYRVSSRKAAQALGFTPACDAHGIVRHLVQNVDAFRNLSDPNYYNIVTFRELERNEKAISARVTAEPTQL